MTERSPPATKGPTTSPTLAPAPCIVRAKPLLAGKRADRVAMAVGCQMEVPTPTRITANAMA